MDNKTEVEIMQSWSRKTDPLVSICCTTFNHESYIEDAIKSFLMQETSFPFEILIRDDCSTDKTTTIIKQYQKKYPNIIFPTYEKENTFSQGIKPMPVLFKKARGEYLALCEGDDYWIDRDKIQIQFEEMENMKNINFCFHSAFLHKNNKLLKNPSWDFNKKQIIPIEKVLSCTGSFSPTSSYFIRKEVLCHLPEWFYSTAPVGDIFLEIFGSLNNGALYIDKPMSVYRVNAKGSWSRKYIYSSNFYLSHWKYMLKSFEYLSKEIDYDLSLKISKCYYHISINKLLNKNIRSFVKNIKISWLYYPRMSIYQSFLYYLSKPLNL